MKVNIVSEVSYLFTVHCIAKYIQLSCVASFRCLPFVHGTRAHPSRSRFLLRGGRKSKLMEARTKDQRDFVETDRRKLGGGGRWGCARPIDTARRMRARREYRRSTYGRRG